MCVFTGDEILTIDDVSVQGKTIDQVAEMMSLTTGTVTLAIKPASPLTSTASRHAPYRTVSVRAQFCYDPHEDGCIPCPELGIAFQIGDILHIIDRDDPHWWQVMYSCSAETVLNRFVHIYMCKVLSCVHQAYREGDDFSRTLAGLIPSKMLWEIMTKMRNIICHDTTISSTGSCCPMFCHKKCSDMSSCYGMSHPCNNCGNSAWY